MLNFKCKFKAGAHERNSFDEEAWEGKHGKLVRIDFDQTTYYYEVDILGEAPTEGEQARIIDGVNTLFYDQLHLGDNNHELDAPSKEVFEKENLYWFSID